MSAPFVAVIMPLSGYEPGVPPRPSPGPGVPGYPSQGLPVYPSQQPLPGFGGGYPSHGLPLPPPGSPGSPEHPIAPLPGAPEQPVAGQGPFYLVIPGHGIVGPLYLPPPSGEAAPKV